MGDDPGRVAVAGRRRSSAGSSVVLANLLLVLGVVRAAALSLVRGRDAAVPAGVAPARSEDGAAGLPGAGGLSLYPEWRDYPHVANFFAPIDFLLVGGIGRLVGADLRGLFLIGRGVSFASGLLVAVVLGVWAGRRYGWGAGVVAAAAQPRGPADGRVLGHDPARHAGRAARPGRVPPDRCRREGWRAAGVGVLVLAAFTKQTAGGLSPRRVGGAGAGRGAEVGRSASSAGGWARSRWSSRGSRSPSSRTSPGRCSARRRRRGTSPRGSI